MLNRDLYQPTVLQVSKRDRIATGLVVLALYGLLSILVLMDLTARVVHVPSDGPAMALLFVDRARERLSAPMPANVTLSGPRVRAPEITIAPEPPAGAPTPAPAQATQAAITSPPNPSENRIEVSSVPGEKSPGSGNNGTAPSAAGQAGAGGAGAGGIDLSDYLRRVSRHIQRFIPRGMPRGTPERGMTYIYLHWAQNGTVIAKGLMQSSGDEWIDRSALLAVTRADRLPPIPPEFRLKEIEGRLPILFSR